MSALVSATTNLTIAIITAYVGTAGVAALAGYGAGARLEFILVPFTYGIGGPAGILIGTNIGGGQGGRALRTAWITLLLSALATEAIGLAAATWPAAWIGSFSGDPAVLAIETTYIRTVGPFFGFFGMGFALYCVGQGTGRAWDGRLPAVSSARRSRSPVALPRSGSEQTSITSSWP
jgi:Na+-driven multidrug efflux pump